MSADPQPVGRPSAAGRPRPPRWGLTDVFAGVIAFLLCSVAVHLIVPSPVVLGHPLLAVGVEQVLGSWLPLGVVVLVASRRRGRGRLSDDFGLRLRPVDLAIGLAAGIALRLVALGVAELVRQASGTPATPFAGGVLDPVVFVLVAVLAASVVSPVVEELYFRGLVLRAIERAVAGTAATGTAATDARRHLAATTAVIGSALLFTAFHLEGVPDTAASVSRLLTLFVVGLVLGALTVAVKRLGPAIVAHAAFNLSVAAIELAATAATAATVPSAG
jgi:membrane protease YdiL (CAAX protease family)